MVTFNSRSLFSKASSFFSCESRICLTITSMYDCNDSTESCFSLAFPQNTCERKIDIQSRTRQWYVRRIFVNAKKRTLRAKVRWEFWKIDIQSGRSKRYVRWIFVKAKKPLRAKAGESFRQILLTIMSSTRKTSWQLSSSTCQMYQNFCRLLWKFDKDRN